MLQKDREKLLTFREYIYNQKIDIEDEQIFNEMFFACIELLDLDWYDVYEDNPRKTVNRVQRWFEGKEKPDIESRKIIYNHIKIALDKFYLGL